MRQKTLRELVIIDDYVAEDNRGKIASTPLPPNSIISRSGGQSCPDRVGIHCIV